MKETGGNSFCTFFDQKNENRHLYVSTVSLWEIALLCRSKKISPIQNLVSWCENTIQSSQIQVIEPNYKDMIESVFLPLHHKDPFDRLLITQARHLNSVFVTKDRIIPQYGIKTFWPD